MSGNNNRNRYIIAERSATEQLMVEIFDRHFRPALRELSQNALVAFIHGPQAVPQLDRASFRQEVIHLLETITHSGETGLISSPNEDNTGTAPNEE